ncbi:MAG: transglutaminase-like domain-containing protein, partial [Planctomycetia bacterium]
MAAAEDKAPAAVPAPAVAPRPLSQTTYAVRHQLSVKDLPADAKQVRIWFWMPEDTPEQRVLDFRIVEAPEGVRITRDPQYGRSWIYAEVAADPARPPRIVTEFQLLRREVGGLADASKATPLTAEHRLAFARELRLDEKHMEVTPEIRKLADELCGSETNPVLQARKCFDYVIFKSDHYSLTGPAPQGKCLGDAMECLAGTGDCCTDQHALFIALCRARGIPCRLIYGSRLNYKNEGKDYDPGYRCWPRFFAPGLGWLPVDVSAADSTKDGDGERWFGGLDDRRIEWAEGRDFDLEPRSAVKPDLVIRGHVEVDGKVHKGDVPGKTPAGFDRVIQ